MKLYAFSAMVGMARRAVPARVVAAEEISEGRLTFEEVASLHATRTSQRDVPTTLTTYRKQTTRSNACPTLV